MKTVTFSIPNISCGHCVKTIQTELKELAGVKEVKADQMFKTAEVTFDSPATEEAIKQLEEQSSQAVAESEGALEAKIKEMKQASVEEINQLRRNWEEEKIRLGEQFSTEAELLKDLRVRELLTESQYQELKPKYGHAKIIKICFIPDYSHVYSSHEFKGSGNKKG
jgi:copper chaperone CopZ